MNKKAVGITAGSIAALLLAGGGGFYALTSVGSSATQLAATDVAKAAKEDLISSVPATGNVAADRELSLTTTLTGPIQSLDAKVGDRVEAQQLLGRIDTTETERELDAQRTSQEAGKLESVHQIEDAQLQLRQLQDSLDQGLNPDINSAQSAVNSARGEYDEAQRQLDQAVATKGDRPEVAESQAAVEQARDAVRKAETASFQSALASVGTATDDPTGIQTASAFLDYVDADSSVQDAHRQLKETEDSYDRVLRSIDRELGDQQRATAASYQAVAEAERALQASNLAVEQQINAQSQAVNHAMESAASASANGAKENGALEYQLSQADLRSPLGGIITAVNGQAGMPAEGPILTVADDSTLLVKSTVKEGDIAQVTVGDEVTFTSPSSPGKEYKGKVTFISPHRPAGRARRSRREQRGLRRLRQARVPRAHPRRGQPRRPAPRLHHQGKDHHGEGHGRHHHSPVRAVRRQRPDLRPRRRGRRDPRAQGHRGHRIHPVRGHRERREGGRDCHRPGGYVQGPHR